MRSRFGGTASPSPCDRQPNTTIEVIIEAIIEAIIEGIIELTLESITGVN